MSRLGSVFSTDAETEFARLRTLIATLTNPTVGLGKVESAGAALENTPKGCIARLGSNDTLSRAAVMVFMRDLAAEVSECIARLHVASEEHFVRFFDHLKRKNDEELSLWIPKADAVTPASAGFGRNPPPAQTRAKPATTQAAAAVDALHTWLAIELEAVMTATHSTKGAVYLRGNDSSAYLRRAASIPAAGDLPQDVALASGSTIGTVVLTGIGTTIGVSRRDAFEAEAQLTGKPAHTSAVVFNVSTAIVLPLLVPSSQTAVGCVVIANKAEPGQPTYSAADEHRAWAFAAACEGVFARYPAKSLLTYTTTKDVQQTLKTLAQIAPVSDRCGDADPLLVHGVPIPTKAKRMLLMRQGTGAASQSAKDAHMEAAGTLSPTAGRRASLASNDGTLPFNDEDVLESVAPYIRNLEMLWHKSLDAVMSLRAECAKWESKVSQREARIVDLEVAMKNLGKQLHRTKADIRRIQRIVPQHLREMFDANPDGLDASASGKFETVDVNETPKQGVSGSTGTLPRLPPAPSTSRRPTEATAKAVASPRGRQTSTSAR
jgi:hypothetical protein